MYFQSDRRAKFLTQNLVIRQTFILDLQSANLGRGDLCAEIQIELGSHRRRGEKKLRFLLFKIVLDTHFINFKYSIIIKCLEDYFVMPILALPKSIYNEVCAFKNCSTYIYKYYEVYYICE